MFPLRLQWFWEILKYLRKRFSCDCVCGLLLLYLISLQVFLIGIILQLLLNSRKLLIEVKFHFRIDLVKRFLTVKLRGYLSYLQVVWFFQEFWLFWRIGKNCFRFHVIFHIRILVESVFQYSCVFVQIIAKQLLFLWAFFQVRKYFAAFLPIIVLFSWSFK